jgi:hypothetical protein
MQQSSQLTQSSKRKIDEKRFDVHVDAPFEDG